MNRSPSIHGISVPKGTPPEINRDPQQGGHDALKDPKLVARLA